MGGDTIGSSPNGPAESLVRWMEFRDDGLMVDYTGFKKQEVELGTLDQETRLMRAMNEIRAYSAKSMTRQQREMFSAMCEKIFEKHGVKPETYQAEFGHLGTPQNLHRWKLALWNMSMKKTHGKTGQQIVTGGFGPKLDAMDMQNNPFRAAYFGGHELNETYKMPVPNASGQNHSYMHPVHNGGGGTNTKALDAKQNRVAGPIQTGKNTF